jgi:AAA15 family ATPase/GTPase
MEKAIVRIKGIEINGFKNVTHGRLDLDNAKRGYKASILGLYGQNGSGKTALIDAISLLKAALSGQPIPSKLADYINVGASFAKLCFEFSIQNTVTGEGYNAVYQFCLRKEDDGEAQNIEGKSAANEKCKAVIFDETISYSFASASNRRKLQPIIDTADGDVFGPKTKYEALVGKDRDTETDLLVAKKLVAATSRSFAFSRELLTVIREKCKDDNHRFVIESLVSFGNFGLFVINTSNNGLISMNALPLTFKYEEKQISTIGNMMISLENPSTIPQEAYSLLKKVVDNMNVVLCQIIPGLTISPKELGTHLSRNGKEEVRIQFVSHKNDKDIPLKYESEGIKKIISILQLLIVVYNKPSITVAIDELDSGVFEYLLGELLRIISENGKGQLIFTSHNLRPLETLDRSFVAFTTTNPENRYIRLSYVKTNHNLRDFYYRDIVLGEQDESVYETTNNYEIAYAFREAGELSGS